MSFLDTNSQGLLNDISQSTIDTDSSVDITEMNEITDPFAFYNNLFFHCE